MKELIGEEAEVDVRVVDISEAKERALNIRLNKHEGEFDETKLINVLADIDKEDETVLKLTGFSDKEIEVLLDQIPEPFEESNEDKLTIADIKESIVKEGDLFEINGKHRVICGDSTETKTYKNLFENNKFDLMITSPPYNVEKEYNKYIDKKSNEEYFLMLKNTFINSREFMNKDRFLCVNIQDLYMHKINLPGKISAIMENTGFIYKRVIYWIKPEGASKIVARAPFPRWHNLTSSTEQIIIHSNELEDKPEEFVNIILNYSLGEVPSKNRPNTKELIPIDKQLLRKYSSNVWRIQPETRMRQHPAPFPIILPENCITSTP